MNKQQTKIIKEMEKGKSFEKACKLASVSQTMAKNWIKLGQRGNKRHEEFFIEYRNLLTKPNEEDIDLIEKSIKLLEKGFSIEKQAKELGISKHVILNWYYQGKKWRKPYHRYYIACKKNEDKENEGELTQKEIALKEKMDIVLNALKEGKSKRDAFRLIDANTSLNRTWRIIGKKGKEPYKYFLEEYDSLKDKER